eukprot:CAMPEP_0116145932 /NCGR_PEP_ID=MMETSP0329-20121206/16889_1 /TAXON_ID=697910 /ORGANISM="Pseudo-nitzschia arenysensis, Strain B593" /LENGTH=571 /DNA_ID=CAMNT_0003641635 /DNA_START=233 /DNA_END=1948 /DNA_ORIENTATION=+
MMGTINQRSNPISRRSDSIITAITASTSAQTKEIAKGEAKSNFRNKSFRCKHNTTRRCLIIAILWCFIVATFNLSVPRGNQTTSTDLQQNLYSSELQKLTASHHQMMNLQSTNGTLVTLVHIGKTGGSALRDLVDYANDYCEINFSKNNLNHNNNNNNDNDKDSPPLSMDSRHNNNNYEKTTLQQHMCALARVTSSKSLVHLDRNTQKTLSADHFLVPIRNPVDRLVSWFYYEKHFQTVKKTRYSQALYELIHPSRCGFASANDLFLGKSKMIMGEQHETNHSMLKGDSSQPSKSLLPTRNSSAEYCHYLSRECLSGAMPCYGHNFFNYEYYLEDILVRILEGLEASKQQMAANYENLGNVQQQQQQQQVLIPRVDVIRAEHSWDDLNRTLLDWTGLPMTPDMEFFYTTRKPFDIDTSAVDDNQINNNLISADAATLLCQTICPELIVYTKLIKYAANLSPNDKAKSKTEIEHTCGFSIDNVCGRSFRYRKIRESKKEKFCEPRRQKQQQQQQQQEESTKNDIKGNKGIDEYTVSEKEKGLLQDETEEQPRNNDRRRRLAFLRETKNLPPC